MATKPPPYSAVANGNPPTKKTELADLWAAAVDDYERRTKRSLRLGSWGSMDAVIQGTEIEKKKLKDFRHDGGKVDKVRTAFKNNLWLIQSVVNVVQIAANAASVSLASLLVTCTVPQADLIGFPSCYASDFDLQCIWSSNDSKLWLFYRLSFTKPNVAVSLSTR
jgi:hypothetical protein